MQVNAVHEQVLAQAVQESTSWAEVKRRCGLSRGGAVHVALRRRVERLGICAEHLDRPIRKYDDERLAALVPDADSVADVLRALGLAQAGGTHAHISRRIKAIGCDTSHFTGRRNARQGGASRLEPENVLVHRPGAERRRSGQLLTRALLAIGRPHTCSGCGVGPLWEGRTLVLSVDHIDGDWRNDSEANLRFLCPNCHSQTWTFCRRARSS